MKRSMMEKVAKLPMLKSAKRAVALRQTPSQMLSVAPSLS